MSKKEQIKEAVRQKHKKEVRQINVAPLGELIDGEHSQNLPLGHYLRKEIRNRLDSVYGPCHALEKHWLKQLKKKHIPNHCNLAEAEQWVTRICAYIGFRKPSLAISKKSHYYAERMTIYVAHKPKWVFVSVMVHELAHNFCYQDKKTLDHGQLFQEIEELIFQAILEIHSQ